MVSDSQRLRVLDQLGILDTEYEEAFDDIVSLAALTWGVPAAAINFIDKDRFWFKAEVGLGARELPICPYICSQTLLEPNPYADLVVGGDFCAALQGKKTPQLASWWHGLQFYAGALIRFNGCVLGALSIFDHTPRNPSERELQVLILLRDQVVRELASRSAKRG
ncbi:hypothetical protein PuT2_01100 [Pusillimonas sp. T2]|nr:hypothetical protein PuT2_01100 [Pusillimonas sp. T2]